MKRRIGADLVIFGQAFQVEFQKITTPNFCIFELRRVVFEFFESGAVEFDRQNSRRFFAQSISKNAASRADVKREILFSDVRVADQHQRDLRAAQEILRNFVISRIFTHNAKLRLDLFGWHFVKVKLRRQMQ